MNAFNTAFVLCEHWAAAFTAGLMLRDFLSIYILRENLLTSHVISCVGKEQET